MNNLDLNINNYSSDQLKQLLNIRQNDIINDYYTCLIECDDDQHVCKRICKELLMNL